MDKCMDKCECPPPATSRTQVDQDDILRAMREFQSLYHQKLEEIDKVGAGENLQLKINIQDRWINDLTAQTEMMAAMVKDLEEEATQRVRMLEKKLQQTSKAAYEVMKRYQSYNFQSNSDDYLQKRICLENDVKSLIEFIRRIREDGKWSISGLQFYDVNYTDLFGQNNFQPNPINNNSLASDSSEKVGKALRMTLEVLDHLPDAFTPDNPENGNGVNFCEDVKTISGLDELNEKLRIKSEECDNLRQNMIDMRSALTEEVACKHDLISSLKKDIQRLEERCVQSDKQTAFKDDIIKELRKEIKLLKQQNSEKSFKDKFKCCEEQWDQEKSGLNKKLRDLENQLSCANDKMCKMKPCVSVRSTCTMMDDDPTSAKKKEKQLEDQIKKRLQEVDDLKCKCAELEKALSNSQARAENLQKAVDLYVNSINVLEASEERAKIEIEQQRITIANLQEALVVVKQELDELRQKNQQDVYEQKYYNNVLNVNLQETEGRLNRLQESYKKLQDTTFQLEIEHFNSLQDLALAETQLHKYQIEFREYEDQRGRECKECKKLKHKNRYYEHVVDCFKQEMGVMSEQLINLQDILNLSNQSCKEENCQLYNAVVDLQKLSERLKSQLQETEKLAMVETQRIKEKNGKIEELSKVIDQKNAELDMHDRAIAEMQLNLENSVLENHELQSTVAHLNTELMRLQCNMQMERSQKSQKVDDCKSQVDACSRSVNDFEDHMNRKNKRICKLQGDCRKQQALLEDTQRELERIKEKSKAKIKQLKKQNDMLKNKVAKNEANYVQLCDEFTCMRDRATELTQQECCRDHELIQYKQVVIEIRQALIEMNASLSEGELRSLTLSDVDWRNRNISFKEDDVVASCRCELNSLKMLMENLRAALLRTSKKILDLENENTLLMQESRLKDTKINDLHNMLSRKEHETCQNVKDLAEKYRASQAEEERLTKAIEDLKDEMKKRMDNRREIVTTQEEIMALKGKIKKMIQDQVGLNRENDRLLAQVTRLQDLINPLEEKNRKLRKLLDDAEAEIHRLREGNTYVQRQKDTIVKELEALQTSYSTTDVPNLKQIGILGGPLDMECPICNFDFKDSVRNLEMELADTRNSRDDVCADSMSMVNNVRAWLDEQRKINERVKNKTRGYCNHVERLRQENNEMMLLQHQPYPQQQRQQQFLPQQQSRVPIFRTANNNNKCGKCPAGYSGFDYQHPWSLGSQGTGSWDSPRDSPSSFLTCSVEEWYAPNYRDDDETDDQNEGLISRIEAVTAGIRVGNRKLNKCREGVVSKDIN